MSDYNHLRISFTPRDGSRPRGELGGTDHDIPVLDLADQYGFDTVMILLPSVNPATVTYLRELADQANQLADQVQTLLDTRGVAA